MSRTTLLIGPPGTGKTEKCLSIVDAALKQGVEPERIAYLSFTRRAAGEAITRAVEKFGFDRDRFPYFRTLHSLAFHELGLHSDQVMQPQHFRELGEKLGGYNFSSDYDETVERANPEGELGDVCLFICQLARSMEIPLEDAWRLVQDSSTCYGPPSTLILPFHVVEFFYRGLEEFKKGRLLLDFTDFLDQCHTELDVDLFILDEAQDNTRQQWRFARQCGTKAAKVYLAGDDDQAVYEWGGADSSVLLQMNGDRETLPLSHRLPQKIFDASVSIVNRIKYRLPKVWAPRAEDGSVDWINSPDECDLREGKWLLLARTNYLCRQLIRAARHQGVIYSWNGSWSNQDPTVKAVLAYEALRRGDKISRSVAALAAKFAGAALIKQADAIGWEDIKWPFESRPDWMKALFRIGVEQREYIRAVRRHGESLNDPGRVRISTIHGAKGAESENVLVLGDWSARVENSFWGSVDQELRVWYVALSRAKEKLFITQPQRFSALHEILCPKH